MGSTLPQHGDHTFQECYSMKFLPQGKSSNLSRLKYTTPLNFILLWIIVFLFHISLNSNFALSFIILNVLCFKACNFNFHKNIFLHRLICESINVHLFSTSFLTFSLSHKYEMEREQEACTRSFFYIYVMKKFQVM